MSDITIRYAESDDDIIAIHRFLLIVAGPVQPGPVDAQKSAVEVWRVVTQDVGAIMALDGDRLVGTMGIIRVTHWWGDVDLLYSRWFFALPRSHAGRPILKEADELAKGMGLELIVINEAKGKVVVLNRHENRDRPNPFLVHPSSHVSLTRQ